MEETDILLFFCGVKCRTEDWSKKKGSFNGCLNKKTKTKKKTDNNKNNKKLIQKTQNSTRSKENRRLQGAAKAACRET